MAVPPLSRDARIEHLDAVPTEVWRGIVMQKRKKIQRLIFYAGAPAPQRSGMRVVSS